MVETRRARTTFCSVHTAHISNGEWSSSKASYTGRHGNGQTRGQGIDGIDGIDLESYGSWPGGFWKVTFRYDLEWVECHYPVTTFPQGVVYVEEWCAGNTRAVSPQGKDGRPGEATPPKADGYSGTPGDAGNLTTTLDIQKLRGVNFPALPVKALWTGASSISRGGPSRAGLPNPAHVGIESSPIPLTHVSIQAYVYGCGWRDH